MNSRGKAKWFCGAALGVLLVSTTTVAQLNNVNWNVSGPAPWNDDFSWTGEVVPDAAFADVAVFGNAGTAEVTATVPDVAGLNLASGTVDIQQGGSLSVVVVQGEAGSGSTTIGRGGTLRVSGNGKFKSATLTSGGLIALGSTDVGFDVDNDYSNGTLRLRISGDGSPVVNVGGTARLSGSIVADFGAGADLSFGNSWEFLKAGDITGQAQVALPAGATLPRGLNVQLATAGGSASLVLGNVPVLSLDRTTGRTEIKNVVGGPLTINGYSIGSANGLLDPQAWNSLASQQIAGWDEANPREQLISELNLLESSTLEVGSSLNLGNAYSGLGALPAEQDVTFQFTTPDGDLLNGLVEYTGPANDLVLRVNPADGEAVIRHLSSFIDPFDVTGYHILSNSGALSVEGWNSFADSGAAGEGWEEANPRPQGLAELNLTASQLFETGTVIPIGSIFTPGSLQDLEFQFATAGGELRLGTVEYGVLDDIQPPGNDCNGDGVVDINDVNCACAAGDVDLANAILQEIGSIAGDADGNGTVEFQDFVVLANNFGGAGQYTDGDFDWNGTVEFQDFVILANNFGQTGGGVAAVPEPSSLTLLGLVTLLLGWSVRRRGS